MKKIILSGAVIGSFLIYSLVHSISGNNPLRDSAPSQSSQPAASVPSTRKYKNGVYTGSVEDAFYGNIQVQIIVTNSQISDVQFLQYPNDRARSIMINTYAMPILKQEVIQAQNSKVDFVSGATDTSQAFIQSLISALQQA